MKKYIINILVWISQGINTLTGGDPDETFSSYLGKLKVEEGGSISIWKYPIRGSIEYGLEVIDEGHTVDAIEDDEGKDSIR